MKIHNSWLRFQIINIQAASVIDICQDSVLDANGTGSTRGLGWGIKFLPSFQANGGSYGGQGGGCGTGLTDKTYGNYNKEFEENPLSNDEFIGSGGGINKTNSTSFDSSIHTRGGGGIILETINFYILGRVDASGYPLSKDGFQDQDTVIGGSGGFVQYR